MNSVNSLPKLFKDGFNFLYHVQKSSQTCLCVLLWSFLVNACISNIMKLQFLQMHIYSIFARAAVCEHALLAILKQYYFLPYINIVTLNPTLNIPAFSFEAGETYTVADGENHTVVVCPVWRSGLCG